ncbi:MAG: hypothetical protein PHD03_02845 [Bacilli bacterium]|nr:hypothetical protein [Bacilli bacterium]MDD4406505.1 hypothetical protein [Bacilli bacterium]
MNNKEDNFELPKKIDEVSNQITNSVNIFDNDAPSQPITQNNTQENVANLTVKEESASGLTNNIQNAFPNQNEAPVNNEMQNNPTTLVAPEPALIPNIPDINEEPIITQQPQINDNNVVFPTPITNLEEPIVEQPINTTPELVITEEPQSNLVTPTPEPTTIQNNQPNEQEVKLEKKIVLEEPIKQEKEKGNAIVGFFALLIILGAILATFWYFISEGIIKLPNNIKLPDGIKLPFQESNTTTTTKAIEQLVISYGLYKESEPSTCPNKPLTLIVNEDKSFLYTNITFDTINNTCNSDDISGTYTLNNDNISLTKENGEVIIVNVANEEGKTILSVPINDKTIKLYSAT